MVRSLEWDDSSCTLRLLDQRLLPAQVEMLSCENYTKVSTAIQNMTVRGAPVIGAAAAFGMALAACKAPQTSTESLRNELKKAGEVLMASRPTAVNLAWAVQRMLKKASVPASTAEDLTQLMIAEAKLIAQEDVQTNRRMAEFGAALIDDGDTIIHHCNTGALATVDWGTALGAIRMAHEQGKKIHVLVDETRPRLQGARLTAWELEQYQIPYHIITDNMAGHFLRSGMVNKVFFGADRVAANGDVCNKIGSYMLALAAKTNAVPVYSVFPTTTVDLNLKSGDLIPIEERDQEEVLGIEVNGQRVTPLQAKAYNPAFDVTPFDLFTALITENGVIYPPFDVNLPRAVEDF
jgi:methylthioribose-1-phosphate isomerase